MQVRVVSVTLTGCHRCTKFKHGINLLTYLIVKESPQTPQGPLLKDVILKDTQTKGGNGCDSRKADVKAGAKL